jgi:monoamine oxidase
MARTLDFKILARWLTADSSLPPQSFLRREFLSKTAVGGVASLASLALTSTACTTLDRWVMGDSARLDNEVMVLGGGLAGLTAAYQLKKNRVPYRLYEASTRLGGRIQTLYHFNSSDQFAEAGAEFLEDSHVELLQLCKELTLKTQDISYDMKSDRGIYWLNRKVVSEKEFRKSLRPLALRFAQLRSEISASVAGELRPSSLSILPQAQNADRQSLADVVGSFKGKIDAAVLETFENICVSEWGVETKEINLLHFLVRLSFEERALAAAPSKTYRIEGGSARLIQILGERVQGVLPGYTMKLEYQLVEIKLRGGGYDCTFKTPKGHDTVSARQVICTLPWSVLKDVEGLRNLELPKKQLAAIENASYAAHSKSVCSYKDPTWKKRVTGTFASQGVFRGQLLGQAYWDSSRGQAGSHGLATSQRGGKRSQEIAGESAAAETLQDLRRFFKDQGAEDNFHLTHWQRKPFAKGSRHHCPPGNYLKHLDMLTSQEEKSRFLFAGEHMSFRDAGTMNGAVKTAMAAADTAMKTSPVKTTK